MKHSYFYSLGFSLLLLAACSGEKASDEKVYTLNIDESIEHFDEDYTSEAYKPLFKNPKTLQLETKDECLLSGFASILDVTPQYIVVGDNQKFFFFDAHSGAYLSKIDRKGDGPEEYSFVTSRFFDDENNLLYLKDKKKIKSYKPDGTFVSEFSLDSINGFVRTTDGYWAIYKREYHKQHLAAFLGKDWKVKRTYFPNLQIGPEKADVYIHPNFHGVDGKAYILLNDTLFTNKKDEMRPAVIINKGKLKMPDEVLGDFQRFMSDGQKYIQADGAYNIGDYLLYTFTLEKGRHSTIWNPKTGELLTHTKSGYLLPYDGKTTISGAISLVKNGKAYSLLSVDKLAKYGLADEESESNPIVLTVDIDD